MIFSVFLFLAIIFLLFLLSMIWPPDSPWAPWWRTSEKTARKMCELANINNKDIVYDLGSGEGTALIIASKEFGAKGVGIEIDPTRFLYSKLLLKKHKLSNSVIIKRGNIFHEDLSNATVVFVYLIPKTLDKLLPKFRKELKKGTKIVSFRYAINLPLKKYDKENNLKMYVI
jgi:cyclopropane fatty-acyl-phospholipid synthase-like methyltransferase